jgi:hypothetical protein
MFATFTAQLILTDLIILFGEGSKLLISSLRSFLQYPIILEQNSHVCMYTYTHIYTVSKPCNHEEAFSSSLSSFAVLVSVLTAQSGVQFQKANEVTICVETISRKRLLN